MEFACLSDDDLGNVRALNRLFLDCLRSKWPDKRACDRPVIPLPELIAALNERQTERLASTPFLLLSLRERDSDYWDDVLAADPNRELFAPDVATADGSADLSAASLCFLWHLARRSAYAARVVSGASLSWCERLGDRTLVSLLASTAQRADLVVPRFSEDAAVWKKLLSAGVSGELSIRNAAHLTAMQTMLTRPVAAPPKQMRAAACRMPAPRTR